MEKNNIYVTTNYHCYELFFQKKKKNIEENEINYQDCENFLFIKNECLSNPKKIFNSFQSKKRDKRFSRIPLDLELDFPARTIFRLEKKRN